MFSAAQLVQRRGGGREKDGETQIKSRDRVKMDRMVEERMKVGKREGGEQERDRGKETERTEEHKTGD